MKVSKIGILVTACLALTLVATGCKKKPGNITYIPGQKATPPADATPTTVDPNAGKAGNSGTRVDNATPVVDTAPPVSSTPLAPNATGGFDTTGWEDLGDYLANRTIFEANTVYFDFDRHEVRASERVKVDEVAVVLKGDANSKVLVEGHCDERGTEEYNRALGERRALSVREYLINSGIAPERVHTISFGEDKPAVPGNNEAAWDKNRRGVFVLLKPKN